MSLRHCFEASRVPVMHQKYTHVVAQEEVDPKEETPEEDTPTDGE